MLLCKFVPLALCAFTYTFWCVSKSWAWTNKITKPGSWGPFTGCFTPSENIVSTIRSRSSLLPGRGEAPGAEVGRTLVLTLHMQCSWKNWMDCNELNYDMIYLENLLQHLYKQVILSKNVKRLKQLKGGSNPNWNCGLKFILTLSKRDNMPMSQ